LTGDTAAQADLLNQILQEKFGGATERVANSITGQFNRVKETFKTFAANLGVQVVPVMTKVLNILGKIVSAFGGLLPLLAAVGAAMLAYHLISMAFMSEEEIASLSLIGKYIAVGIAKL